MFLGIDLGTSGVKAVVVDENGAVLGQGSAPLSVSRPRPLWSEQDPEHWWDAAIAAVRAIEPELRAAVRGIGLAGQMHGATIISDGDRPLRPAILWNDGRSFAECEELETAVPALRRITGNLAMPGFTAPKLLWLRRHKREHFAQIRKVLLPKDYLRLRMTGAYASDMSDSAGTLWLDVAARAWSEPILKACGLSVAQMPEVFEGPELTGNLRAEVAALWGTPQAPVAAGGGDNAAGAAGIGAVSNGDAFLSLGTSGVIFVARGAFQPNPERAVHTFCHCVPKLWHQMSVHLSAASCIDWAARLVGADSPAHVFDLAESAGAGAGGEIFLPYLSGERTPHNDPHVRGALLNLDHDTTPARIAQAVLEGVAFAFADGLDALHERGPRIEALTVIGGGARSQYWGKLIAAALNTRLVYRRGGDVGPALGAARLAQAAVDGGDIAAVCAAPTITNVIEPDDAIIAKLAKKRAQFSAAYPRVRPDGEAR